MTGKKRFTISKHGGLYTIFDYGKIVPVLDGEPIVNLLNELEERNNIAENEIARLELINNKLQKEDYTNYIDKIKELTEDNQALKKKNQYYLKVMFALKNYIEKEDYERITNAVNKIKEEILSER